MKWHHAILTLLICHGRSLSVAGVFVTGASGFVARNTRKALTEEGFQVVSASRSNFTTLEDEKALITADYTEEYMVSEIRGFEAAIHLVGSGRQTTQNQYQTSNQDTTCNVISLCRMAGIGRIIYLSGLGVSPDTTLGYFISKYKAEQAISESGLEYVIFRPSYIVGNDDHLTENLTRQSKEGGIVVPGSGRYAIQPISIHDVAAVLVRAVTAGSLRNRILDMVGPQTVTFAEYARMFAGPDTPVSHMDMESAYRQAILSEDPRYGVDDLNIMVAGFTGDHTKLLQTTNMKFRTIQQMVSEARGRT